MNGFVSKVIGPKKEWRTMEARDDVAAFCDARVGGPTSYLDNWRASLNRTVAAKLAE